MVNNTINDNFDGGPAGDAAKIQCTFLLNALPNAISDSGCSHTESNIGCLCPINR